MNARQMAAILRNTERTRAAREERRVREDRCPQCGEHSYPVGPYRICRNLRCKRLVAK